MLKKENSCAHFGVILLFLALLLWLIIGLGIQYFSGVNKQNIDNASFACFELDDLVLAMDYATDNGEGFITVEDSFGRLHTYRIISSGLRYFSGASEQQERLGTTNLPIKGAKQE